MSTSSAAKALRDSFGDRKLPAISRKITACVACRRLKIKCHMDDGKPPCTRCKARELPCAVNRSLQAILESDASWKEQLEQRLRKVERSLNLGSDTGCNTAAIDHDASNTESLLEIPSSSQRLEGVEKVTLNLSGSLGAFPASSLMDVPFTNDNSGAAYLPDLISCGTISLETANECFIYYKEQLDPLIHHILGEKATLAEVRARSSLLTAAIITVAAFCTGSNNYKACLNAYQLDASRKLFLDKYEFDDVRALCIGAFWLSDISSALNGMAVRIGTQLDLHRCITKMPHSKRECYDRTRLYFLLYTCDHHCSLIYGRPPMTTEFRSLKGPGAFLQSEFSTKVDLDLISQVEFWSLNRRVFDLFGSDIQSTIVNQRFIELERLSDAFQRWYQDWLCVLALPVGSDSIPRRMFDFYFHSAKLYLFSHVFRGPSEAEMPTKVQGGDGMARHAADHALSVLRCAVDSDETHPLLQKLPFYFGTMIAFASVCLIRTTLREAPRDDVKATESLHYLRRVCEVLQGSPLAKSSTHPLPSIARSLEAAISGQGRTDTDQLDQSTTEPWSDLSFDFDLFASDPMNLTFPGGEDNWYVIRRVNICLSIYNMIY